jgi:hypothetical protein
VSTAYGLDVQSSGKVIYGSLFNEYNGTPVNKMVRLNNDASVDLTFNNGSGPNNGPVYKIKALGNDDLMVAGWFSEFDGHVFPGGLVKLKKDGVLDTTFHANFTPPTAYYDFKDFNDKILMAAYINGKYDVTALNHNGEVSDDFLFPKEIVEVKNASKFFVRDNNTFFILGNLIIEGQSRPATLTKILYNPVAPLQTLSISSTDVSTDVVKYKTFPNPSQREITFDVAQSYDLRIVKFTGEVVIETKVEQTNNSVDISKLRPETYVIQLISGGKRQTSILIKN